MKLPRNTHLTRSDHAMVISPPSSNKQNKVMINPEIISIGKNIEEREEGCLSIPGYNAKVKRPSSLKVKYIDENKKDKTIDAEGLLATCIQHEIDHLNGILFIDHLSKLKREIILKKAIKEYSKN